MPATGSEAAVQHWSSTLGPTLARNRFWLGSWLIDPVSNWVSNGALLRSLNTMTMRVLVKLSECHGQIVPREDLLETIRHGNDSAASSRLNDEICRLRQLLGDRSRRPQYIKTVFGRGYRLLLEPRIEPLQPAPPAHSATIRPTAAKTASSAARIES